MSLSMYVAVLDDGESDKKKFESYFKLTFSNICGKTSCRIYTSKASSKVNLLSDNTALSKYRFSLDTNSRYLKHNEIISLLDTSQVTSSPITEKKVD